MPDGETGDPQGERGQEQQLEENFKDTLRKAPMDRHLSFLSSLHDQSRGYEIRGVQEASRPEVTLLLGNKVTGEWEAIMVGVETAPRVFAHFRRALLDGRATPVRPGLHTDRAAAVQHRDGLVAPGVPEDGRGHVPAPDTVLRRFLCGELGECRAVWRRDHAGVDPRGGEAVPCDARAVRARVVGRVHRRLGPKLVDKIHVYTGTADTYFLNNSTRELQEWMKTTANPHYEGYFLYGDGKPHCWSGPVTQGERLKEMAQHIMAHKPDWATAPWWLR